MVDFGPRLTGSEPHNDYIAWLEREFTTAGLELIPCDEYQTMRWLPDRVGLDVLDGATPGPARVGAYFARCKETPEGGGLTVPLLLPPAGTPVRDTDELSP